MGEKPSFFNPEQGRDDQLKRIVETENDIIDARSEAHFTANLFNADALIAAKLLNPWKSEDPANLRFDALNQRFRAELATRRSMLGRLYLFTDGQYLPYLNSLDLDKTRNPRDLPTLDHMVKGYRRMREVVIERGWADDELLRETSGREIHFRPPAMQEAHKWSIGVRNRPLLRFELEAKKQKYQIEVTKRMTFAVPTQLAFALTEGSYQNARQVTDQNSMEYMENMLDEHDPSVRAIRTLYYVSSEAQD